MITATWDPVARSYALTSTLPGSVTWIRSANWPDGRNTYLNLGTGNPKTDAMVPLDGAVVTWTASNGTADEELSLEPPQAAFPVLSLPSDPGAPAVDVVVFSQRSWDVQGRPYLYEVLDKKVPWVEPQPPIERTGEMVLRVDHPGGPFPGQALARIRGILRTGQPMLLRTTCHARVETLAFIALSFTEAHRGDENQHGPDRDITIRWRAVEPLWGDDIVIGKRIWLTVPLEFGTWDQVKATGLTWDQLAYG